MTHLIEFLIIFSGAIITFKLSSLRFIGPIRASSGTTLIFALIVKLFPFEWPTYTEVLFFGGTFIGMTGVERMFRFTLPLSCVLFNIYFFSITPYLKGIGGALGLGAFLSVSLTALLGWGYRSQKNKYIS
jgi:hypothetical protein